MTRMSSVSSTTASTTLASAGRFFVAAIVVACAGCAAFRTEDDLLDDRYGNGIFRPEGESAERDKGKSNLMQSIGLVKPRRVDLELAKSQYAEADQMFAQAQTLQAEERADMFRAASEKYLESAKNWQSSDLAQDALLASAESLFFAEDYYQAEQIYSKLVKEYPKTRHLDHIERRIWDIGDYWLKVGIKEKSPFYYLNLTDPKQPWNDTGGHGERVFEKMRMNNPTGKLGDDATMRLAMQHYQSEEFEEAASTFAELRSIYPDSEHQFDAQRYELQSLLASYQGPAYSSVPLDDAKTRVKQIARQFPVKSSEHGEELNKAHGTIRYLEAERIWSQAQYRMDRDENAAAQFHLKRILEEFADTPFAEKASAARERIKDARQEPAQHFKFIADLFGENTNDRPWIKDK